MTKILEKVKVILSSEKGKKFIFELKSAFATFVALFLGILIANPAINLLVHTDLPTMNQLKDVGPVILDSLYRAAWVFFLSLVGLKSLVNRK